MLDKFDKKKLKIGFRIIIAFSAMAFLLTITPVALSKYSKEATSTATVGLAMYLLHEDYYTESINLMNLEPREAPYVYTFKIANYYNNQRSDTDLTYDLSLRLTTNMPLTYELYKNYDTNNNILTDNEVEADEDGTYFRTLSAPSETLLYTGNNENIYTLYVYFPLAYNSVNYQDLIEYIEINVDSHQVVD